MTTFYLDLEGGNDSNDGTSFANRWLTFASGATAARIAPGDIIRVMASPDPTSIGNATWNNNSGTVTLASALTATIDNCETAWTASSNVTATRDSTTTLVKENTYSAKLVIADAFTTGLAAYYATGTLDLSGYQQVSFWVRTTAAVAAGRLSLRLCSDTAGATTVDTIAIPAIPAANQWQAFTVNTGGALGSAIKSVALYCDIDPGIVTVYLDNIIACKAVSSDDALSLVSLIGKNTTGETFWGIKSIVGTAVTLDLGVNSTISQVAKYPGATETVTTYKRETIRVAMAATSTAAVHAIQDFGTDGNLIYFEGGYDRTNMSTQSGETWLGGGNGNGYGIDFNSKSFVSLNKFGAVRFNNGIRINAAGCSISYCPGLNNNSAYGIGIAWRSVKITTIYACANGTSGIYCTDTGNIFIDTAVTISNTNNGLHVTRGSITVKNLTTGYQLFDNGIYVDGGRADIWSGNSANNTSSGVSFFGGTSSVYLWDFTINEATEVSFLTTYANHQLFSQRHDNTDNNHTIFTDGGQIKAETSVRKTASGLAWRLAPTATTRTANYPLKLKLATVAINASGNVTVKCWMQRSHASLTLKLVVPAGQAAGPATEQSTAMTEAADTWEEVSVTFTPQAAGAVEVYAYAWGGTTYYGYADDMSFSQA